MKFNVTFPFKKLPYYTVTCIRASTKQEALEVATQQMKFEIGAGNPHKKPIIEEVK